VRQFRKPGTLYVAVEDGGPSKIGVAVEPERRVRVIAKQCPAPVRLVWSMPHADCHRVETRVRKMLAKHRHAGFRVEGNTEWFDLPPEQVIAAAEKAMRARIPRRKPRTAARAQTLQTIAALDQQKDAKP
jgi:hypothetical protein